ncbi:MAG: hypothetical protein ACK5WY_06350 [Holosporaceae bacterium]|jgi:hypothetical protein|nr:hypothetical protein [Rhodospirillaceae bacterium]
MAIDSVPTFRTQDLALKALWQAVDRLDHLMQRLDEVETLEKQSASPDPSPVASTDSAASAASTLAPSHLEPAPADPKVVQLVSDRLDSMIDQLEALLRQVDGGGTV